MLETVMKSAAFIFNCVLLLVLVICAVCLTSTGVGFLAAAGGMPQPSSVGWALQNPIATLNTIIYKFTSGTLSTAAFNYVAAWVVLIFAAGSWWMTALGLRWLYHTMLRIMEAVNS